ncbi:MAG: hypothetical protein JKY08_00225 [Flavobacteriaceae bacterium]|nr:hypothetical protein [Flavobacteriaceae bacterium]
MEDRPINSSEWRTYTIIGKIDSNSKGISFGGICNNNGRFYFDNFKISFQGKNGDFKAVTLSNPSFEKPIIDNLIPHWTEGISSEHQRVKGFKITSSKDASQGIFH